MNKLNHLIFLIKYLKLQEFCLSRLGYASVAFRTLSLLDLMRFSKSYNGPIMALVSSGTSVISLVE